MVTSHCSGSIIIFTCLRHIVCNVPSCKIAMYFFFLRNFSFILRFLWINNKPPKHCSVSFRHENCQNIKLFLWTHLHDDDDDPWSDQNRDCPALHFPLSSLTSPTNLFSRIARPALPRPALSLVHRRNAAIPLVEKPGHHQALPDWGGLAHGSPPPPHQISPRDTTRFLDSRFSDFQHSDFRLRAECVRSGEFYNHFTF